MSTLDTQIWEDVSEQFHRDQDEERWIRRIDLDCWISVLYRRTGFGCMEWETALVFRIQEGSRPKRWESDDRDVLIIRGDWRDELATVPKEDLRKWYSDNIDGNRNTMETLLRVMKTACDGRKGKE